MMTGSARKWSAPPWPPRVFRLLPLKSAIIDAAHHAKPGLEVARARFRLFPAERAKQPRETEGDQAASSTSNGALSTKLHPALPLRDLNFFGLAPVQRSMARVNDD